MKKNLYCIFLAIFSFFTLSYQSLGIAIAQSQTKLETVSIVGNGSIPQEYHVKTSKGQEEWFLCDNIYLYEVYFPDMWIEIEYTTETVYDEDNEPYEQKMITKVNDKDVNLFIAPEEAMGNYDEPFELRYNQKQVYNDFLNAYQTKHILEITSLAGIAVIYNVHINRKPVTIMDSYHKKVITAGFVGRNFDKKIGVFPVVLEFGESDTSEMTNPPREVTLETSLGNFTYNWN